MKTEMDAVLGHLFSAVQKPMVTIFGQFKGCTNKLDTPIYFTMSWFNLNPKNCACNLFTTY